MLGKLLKHEFIATARFMWIIYAAMAVMSLFANLSIHILSGETDYGLINGLMVTALVLWVIMLFLSVVATFVLMLRRFQKNLLTEEGYLMFTLPASVHGLLLSKLIVAAVWMIATFAMIVLCVFVAVISTEMVHQAAEMIQELFRMLRAAKPGDVVNVTLVLLELAGMAVIGLCLSCLQFYSAMAIGHGFSNHKWIWSVLAYFVQSTVISILANVGIQSLVRTGLLDSFDILAQNGAAAWHTVVLSSMGISIALGVVFYLLTAWNLKNRLNLA